MDDNNASSPMDIEQSLVQQFNCLCTSDREDLISQLQRLLGNSHSIYIYIEQINCQKILKNLFYEFVCIYYKLQGITFSKNRDFCHEFHQHLK